jgi:tRNA(His) 5'-end guanylyltransferase
MNNMPVNDELGKRMKEYYEGIPKTKLMRRCPVVLRLDGKAFHTFTRGFQKPFDKILMKSMQETMKHLCENIQGCVFGYTQSEEITLILIDYQKLNSSAWFDYEVMKMCSIAASMATMAFNQYFTDKVAEYYYSIWDDAVEDWNAPEEEIEYCKTLIDAGDKGAMFDARCFNIPKEEVANLIYWRQLDATRNSIQMVGQANFSQRELHGKSCNKIQDMLMLEKGINWNDFPIYQKRGSCCIKNMAICEPYGNRMLTDKVPEGHWFIDKEIPIFKGEDRDYIERFIYVGE